MTDLKIRNDDISFDTTLEEITIFCNICDKYNFPIIQCITPVGKNHHLQASWSNDKIFDQSGHNLFIENKEVFDYLKSRNDLIALHGGLFHSHRPTREDIKAGKALLESWGFNPTYYVAPFNEMSEGMQHGEKYEGMEVIGLVQRIEDYLPKKFARNDIPSDPIVYLHSWRFIRGWYTFGELDECLRRLSGR